MNKIKSFFLVVLLLSFPFLASAGTKTAQVRVILAPKKVGPGDLLLVTVKNAGGPVEGAFDGKKIYFNPSQNSSKAIVGIDLFTEPGTYDLKITCNGAALRRSVVVSKKKYPVQRLKLPKDMVELTPENEARVEREQKKMAAIWPIRTDRHWTGDFTNPREGEIVTTFGVKRFMNNIPKSPHTGVDVSADEGDEVYAPNSGVVSLVDDLYYSGNSIVLDHGQGIFTMFFHLSKILVVPGQTVKKGDVIGLVGSTGRATGPHLHWGARVLDARVDPLELIHLDLE